MSDVAKAIVAICGVIVAVLGFIQVQQPQSPPGGGTGSAPSTRPGPADACLQGFVWREAYTGDHVCVTSEERGRVAADNAAARSRIDPNGAYGADSCVQGYVWRGARDSDHVCVTSEEHDRVVADNAAGPSRVAP
jgi:hypothetical protein